MIDGLFLEIDAQWPPVADRVRLSVFGSGALLLRTDYRRGTKDGDVLETMDITAETKTRLLALAGRDSPIHKRRNIYVEVVPNARLEKLEIHALDIVDVVVSKLAPFRESDRIDIEAMIDRGLVPHDRLVDRFRSAVDYLLGDAREVDLRRYVEHLHIVERDMLGVDESEIELPSWI